ncbi:hypothetical protein [Pseudomonas typographi]|uniref:Uncharacterized protein n=1 Tax=Pseudomonas typographi TaxID=2715964 RepID=A0ABR7ZB22_9PSED|nr:hypothetical protein [Pseudomonas typographi]MBD1553848.1 hypothetical protein [Pseudomonas typographi]MBD1602498.1 hypothetical protein [Pseudomonas typographi]
MKVLDAGTGMLPGRLQRYGREFEVYRCPDHRNDDCGMCGGTGFRQICNQTACHENGCQGHCSRTADDFRAQQKR